MTFFYIRQMGKKNYQKEVGGMRKFIVLYAAFIIVMFFVLGCAANGKGRSEDSGYKTKFEFPQLEPETMPEQEEAPWEAQ